MMDVAAAAGPSGRHDDGDGWDAAAPFPAVPPRPPPCSWLSPGRTFRGSQRLPGAPAGTGRAPGARGTEDWAVSATIHMWVGRRAARRRPGLRVLGGWVRGCRLGGS